MKKRLLLIGTGVLACVIAVVTLFRGEDTPAVQYAILTAQTAYRTVSCKGEVTPVKSNRISVGSPAVITAVHVTQGDTVAVGTPLFSYRLLDSADLDGVLGAYTQEAGKVVDDLQTFLGNESILAAAEYFAATGELPGYFKDFYLPTDSPIKPDRKTGVIYAPIDGTVTELHVSTGDTVSGILPSVTVSDLRQLIVTLDIPEIYAGQIKPGLPVNISGVAFGNAVYGAEITEVLPEVKTVGGLLSKAETYICARATVSAESLLMTGLSVSGCVFVETVENSITVPFSAITMDTEGDEYVFLLREGKACKEPLTYLFENGEGVVTKDIFREGDAVILQPDRNLEDGMAVKCVETVDR